MDWNDYMDDWSDERLGMRDEKRENSSNKSDHEDRR